MRTILVVALMGLAAVAGRADTDAAKRAADDIAKAAGFMDFNTFSEVRFTFNAHVGDKNVTRSWVWWPKENKVRAGASGMEYVRSNMTEEQKAIDAQFINDQYWLTFPFHLIWDSGKTLKLAPEPVPAPISGTPMSKLTVVYKGADGYTPGDGYDLYFGENYLIQEWVYRKGNGKTPTRLSTWQEYENFEGWRPALNHVGPDGFRVWFTDVAVTK